MHVTRLRMAIDSVREAAYLSPAVYSESPQAGGFIRAVHVTEMRAALSQALAALGLPMPSLTNPSLGAGTMVRRAHLQELRDATK